MNIQKLEITAGIIITITIIITTILYFRDVTAIIGSNATNFTSHIIPLVCKVIQDLPDPTCTPGTIDPAVSQDNIKNTICVAGYTKTVRPPTSYTKPLKIKLMHSYNFTDDPSNYELDHLISLELGGSPRDVKNLWPEPYYTQYNAHVKDKLENYLHKQVCSGSISLSEAQKEIATDWITSLVESQHP